MRIGAAAPAKAATSSTVAVMYATAALGKVPDLLRKVRAMERRLAALEGKTVEPDTDEE